VVSTAMQNTPLGFRYPFFIRLCWPLSYTHLKPFCRHVLQFRCPGSRSHLLCDLEQSVHGPLFRFSRIVCNVMLRPAADGLDNVMTGVGDFGPFLNVLGLDILSIVQMVCAEARLPFARKPHSKIVFTTLHPYATLSSSEQGAGE
jgi:hypothetical protein